LGFVRDALTLDASSAFLDAFLPLQARVARLGLDNSLVQVALKLTLPGMPDIYQGSELWDLSLVDPDNRRPVDFARRERLLEEVTADMARDPMAALRDMLGTWRDGRLKLAVTAALLALRRRHPALFAEGGYTPLTATGDAADRICAFARTQGEERLVVVTRRFPARPLDGAAALPLPPALAGEAWRDLLTGRQAGAAETLPLGELLGELPVAVLVPASAASVLSDRN
ncbi:MAG: malto-oligosyltrehalose synthase, partial [Acetobacteraceae bacterium]|nr:malto-oligosyltrehalose synthase [Acetobacteraceae bacterium]